MHLWMAYEFNRNALKQLRLKVSFEEIKSSVDLHIVNKKIFTPNSIRYRFKTLSIVVMITNWFHKCSTNKQQSVLLWWYIDLNEIESFQLIKKKETDQSDIIVTRKVYDLTSFFNKKARELNSYKKIIIKPKWNSLNEFDEKLMKMEMNGKFNLKWKLNTFRKKERKKIWNWYPAFETLSGLSSCIISNSHISSTVNVQKT